jgi:hypothetical protein
VARYVSTAGADLQSVPTGIRQNGTGYKPAPAKARKQKAKGRKLKGCHCDEGSNPGTGDDPDCFLRRW